MQKINLKSLNAKDKMLIAKAVADIALETYKSNSNFILNQILAKDKYVSDFGQFYKSTNSAKTVKEVLDKKQQDLEKLQKEIAELEKLDKTAQYTEKKDILNSKHSAIADKIAQTLLQELFANLDNKKLDKALSKSVKV